MESEATPRDDREQGTSARDKFESRACLRGGWEVEQYAHRLGAVVSQFIVDSLGCPSQEWAGAGQCWQIDWRTCSWAAAAAASAIFQSAFMSLLMSREERDRGLERRRGTARPMRNTANASFIYERRLLSPCPALPMHVPKMRLISRHTQRRVPLHPLLFLFLPRFPLIPLPSPAMVFAFINCLTCPLI